MTIEITRSYDKNQTKGDAVIIDNGFPKFEFKTLELPWLNNMRNISCIPEGAYMAEKHNSPSFGASIWIRGVLNRSEILMHIGNFVGSNNPRTGRPDLRGCIAPGDSFGDMTADGVDEIKNSGVTMRKILEVLPDKFEVKIKS